MKHCKNKYYRRSHISEAKFRHLLKCFSLDLNALEAYQRNTGDGRAQSFAAQVGGKKEPSERASAPASVDDVASLVTQLQEATKNQPGMQMAAALAVLGVDRQQDEKDPAAAVTQSIQTLSHKILENPAQQQAMTALTDSLEQNGKQR